MRRGSGINKGTDAEQSAKGALIKRGPNSVAQGRQVQDLRGGRGVQGPGLSRGGPARGSRTGPEVYTKTFRNCMDLVQEVPVSQMAQGTPPWPTPPPDFKVLGGGKGEVKPPKCPTRHPRVGGYTGTYMRVEIYICIHTLLRIHTYLHTYIPTYLHTYIPTYVRTYIHTCKQMMWGIYACIHRCTHMCTYTWSLQKPLEQEL